jgi:hypothetical protein
MFSTCPFLFRIGTLVLGFGAILSAQIGLFPKLPKPLTRHEPTCINCVRDLSGRISQNPAPIRAFRATHPCPTTGSLRGSCPGYVVDRIKALKAGATDTAQNLRWRTLAQAAKELAKRSVK